MSVSGIPPLSSETCHSQNARTTLLPSIDKVSAHPGMSMHCLGLVVLTGRSSIWLCATAAVYIRYAIPYKRSDPIRDILQHK